MKKRFWCEIIGYWLLIYLKFRKIWYNYDIIKRFNKSLSSNTGASIQIKLIFTWWLNTSPIDSLTNRRCKVSGLEPTAST